MDTSGGPCDLDISAFHPPLSLTLAEMAVPSQLVSLPALSLWDFYFLGFPWELHLPVSVFQLRFQLSPHVE